MENDLVDQNNRRFISGTRGLFLIKQLFDTYLCEYENVLEYDDVVYWGTTYQNNGVLINFQSGRGLLEFKLEVNNNDIDLYNLYNIDSSTLIANEESISFIFQLINEYLKTYQESV